MDWTPVVDVKKMKREAKIKARREEKERWEKIQTEIPHVVTPLRARRLQRKLNIDKLEEKLLSVEWIDYQQQGWIYSRTFKPKNFSKIPLDAPEIEYSTLELDNGWGDKVLFYRPRLQKHEQNGQNQSEEDCFYEK